jgi:hypothetical protein
MTLPAARWWTVRAAQNRKPATYRDTSRRRHAHTACVLRARRAGRLPLREEVDEPGATRPSWWRRILHR